MTAHSCQYILTNGIFLLHVRSFHATRHERLSKRCCKRPTRRLVLVFGSSWIYSEVSREKMVIVAHESEKVRHNFLFSLQPFGHPPVLISSWDLNSLDTPAFYPDFSDIFC